MRSSRDVMFFKPSKNAAFFVEVMDRITAIKINGLAKGRPVPEIRADLNKAAEEMGWTEKLYIEKLTEYHAFCRQEH